MLTAPAVAPITSTAWQAAEAAARQSYGRLLAWLARQWRDMAAAEDALATAPSLGAAVAHAVACAQAGEVQRALVLLAALDSPRLTSYQPFWVAQG